MNRTCSVRPPSLGIITSAFFAAAHWGVTREVGDHIHDRLGTGVDDDGLGGPVSHARRLPVRSRREWSIPDHIRDPGALEMPHVDAFGATHPDSTGQRLVNVTEKRGSGTVPPD